jgi:hypothetical protein
MLKSFIINNLNSDLHRLLLTAQRYPDIDMPYAVSQIEALRKVKDKIPSWFNPALQFPPSLSLEQSSSEAAATYKSALFSGQIMADLTGGMGIDSFFWSKSFDTVHYVEQSEQLCRVAQHNFEVLSANESQYTIPMPRLFLLKTLHDSTLFISIQRAETNKRIKCFY